jgi:hypothetical protein
MYLAVTCKNTTNPHDNLLHGYRIRIPEGPAERFQVVCDFCGKSYWYDPEDVLQMSD